MNIFLPFIWILMLFLSSFFPVVTVNNSHTQILNNKTSKINSTNIATELWNQSAINASDANTSLIDGGCEFPVENKTLAIIDANISTESDYRSTMNLSDTNTSVLNNGCAIAVDEFCPVGVPCNDLDADCLQCDFNNECSYNSDFAFQVKCVPKSGIRCTGTHNIIRHYQCRYCYQLEPWQYDCNYSISCSLLKPHSFYPARPTYTALCKAHGSQYCLGRRCFYRNLPCNWSRGCKWSTALILSITLGGFGVDRFYLGFWHTAIGKLLSFGGLGVWTIVDVILIAIGYIGPQDGSLYV